MRSRLISAKVPEPRQSAREARCRLEGIRYQTKLKALMRAWIESVQGRPGWAGSKEEGAFQTAGCTDAARPEGQHAPVNPPDGIQPAPEGVDRNPALRAGDESSVEVTS